jgi:hypothetical protein
MQGQHASEIARAENESREGDRSFFSRYSGLISSLAAGDMAEINSIPGHRCRSDLFSCFFVLFSSGLFVKDPRSTGFITSALS